MGRGSEIPPFDIGKARGVLSEMGCLDAALLERGTLEPLSRSPHMVGVHSQS